MPEIALSLIALLPAMIWAISPIIYRDFLKSGPTLIVNFYRMLFASSSLIIPFLIFGYNKDIIYAILSGILTLTIGDSLYLTSIKKIGASIAAPVVYTYVFFSQIAATILGENVKFSYFISSILIIIGIAILSRGNKSEMRTTGIIIALSCALFWTIGQAMIKLATLGDMNFASIAFARTCASCLALATLSIARKEKFHLNTNTKGYFIFAITSIADLALGSSLFIFSIAYVGLALTIIITSASPLFTQIIAKLSGKESPSLKDILGSCSIIVALILTLAF
ncbi:MAG TPA: DMT family transporter [Geobacterales bacterium]|nr:DMT family transporter [Geobacterales bacterium]